MGWQVEGRWAALYEVTEATVLDGTILMVTQAGRELSMWLQ